MNLNRNPSIEQLQQIFVDVDDDEGTHVLWVHTNGDVHLVVRNAQQYNAHQEPIKSFAKLRFEGFIRGNGWTGKESSQDLDWMERIFKALIKYWKNPPRLGYVDDF